MKTNKCKNKKVTINGEAFDSKREAARYQVLLMLQRTGVISDLQRQVKYVLIPAQRINGKVVERECAYIADFVYVQDGATVVEDSKGYRNPSSATYAKFVIKRKLMLEKYGIRIFET